MKWFKVCHNKLCSHTVRGQTVETCLGTTESKWNMAWSIKWLKWWWHFLDALREIRLLQKMEAIKQHKRFSNRKGCWSRCNWYLIDLTMIIICYDFDNQMIIYSSYDIKPFFLPQFHHTDHAEVQTGNEEREWPALQAKRSLAGVDIGMFCYAGWYAS